MRAAPTCWWAGRLAAALLVAGCAQPDPPAAPAEPVGSVRAARVSRGPVVASIETLGTAEFDPEALLSAPAPRSGQIADVQVLPGQVVHKGDVLLTIGPVPSAAPEARQAQIDVDFAQREVARVQRLTTERLATNQDLDAAQKQLASARAALEALGGGQAAAPLPLRADRDGVVARVLVQPGQLVQAGQEAAALAVRRAITVRAGFEVEDLTQLRSGAPVTVEAIYGGPQDEAQSAVLSELHAVADPATQLVDAQVRIGDPAPWLLAGMRVRVRVEIARVADALRLPHDALLNRDGVDGVFVLADGMAHWRPVRLGISESAVVEIRDGLAADAVVATAGRTALADGSRVRIDGEIAP